MSKTAAFGFEWEGAGVSVLIGFLALLISVRAAGHYSEGCWSFIILRAAGHYSEGC